ncbi:MAG: homoserine O-succinyltransferase [Clostridia bacterium]|nr:homoserine O-succinyltransferase [Clostridia bacterium]
MPIRIPSRLPAREILENEYICVMDELRAIRQDIRPLKILVLNLMPTKETTETQLIRLLSNTPLQINLTLLRTASHTSSHTSADHMETFYRTYDEIKDSRFDGMIITGAPVETLRFEDVDYWKELCTIFEWAKTNVYSTFYICWAAQAGLYYHHGIEKHPTDAKVFGVFHHNALDLRHPLLRGFDEQFLAPHSRHTCINREDILARPALNLLAESKEAGVYMVATNDLRHVFVTGHSEYDAETLSLEYKRDLAKGLPIAMPVNYYPENDASKQPLNVWRAHANLLFGNWLNYAVYQRTPFDLNEL